MSSRNCFEAATLPRAIPRLTRQFQRSLGSRSLKADLLAATLAAWGCPGKVRGPNQAADKPLSRELRKGATMDEIKGIARVKFHPGKVEEWKRLTEQAMEIVRTRDTGTLQYEVFLNEDESEAVVYERYRDADAAIEHFSNISHLMEPLLATASITGEVLGTPNAMMNEMLGKGGPRLFTPWMALQDQELVEEE
jgi:quinol monooxygenase YgiN